MINTARNYQDNNQLLQKSVQSFQTMLIDITAGGDTSLLFWRGRFYMGGEKVPYRRETANVINAMVEFLAKLGIGGINFFQSSQDVLPERILEFVRLLIDSVKEDDPVLWLNQKLKEGGQAWVEIVEKQDDDEEIDYGASLEKKRREMARNTYSHALETVREVANKAFKSSIGVRKARRLAQNIVDLISEDTALMIGLATIKDYDDYTYTHSVNVSLLSTCLGKHVGLSDTFLEYLSVCGLFHDLGKVGVSKEILLKQGALTDSEWVQMKAHPLIGVRQILKMNAPRSLRSRIILGPFEHHLNPDLTGYPMTLFTDQLSLMGKILRITDVYEALTAERAYRSRPYTPHEALRKMWSDGVHCFDPILLKCFIGMVGTYPIGSFVELSDGSIALVMDYPDDNQRSQPVVLKLHDDGSGGLARGEKIYLPDYNDPNSSSRLDIVRGLQPSDLGVNAAQFFLQS